MLARGIRLATGRVVRIVGVPDVAPVGPLLRRLGGVLARPDEVAGLLRAGEVVGVLLDRDVRPRAHAGPSRRRCSPRPSRSACRVVPVALVGRSSAVAGASALGPAVAHPDGRGPLALAELAERARTGVQELLDEALPPRGLF